MTATHVFDAIVNGWWQGILLTAIVWLVLRDLPRLSAATRLAIWHVTLAIVLLLPVLQRIPLPSWRVAEDGGAGNVQPATAALVDDTPLLAASPALAPVRSAAAPRAWFEFSGHTAETLVVLAWFLAWFQLLRLAVGYWAVRRLKRRSQPAQMVLPVSLGRVAEVMVSDRIAMPMAVGYRRPAILLPRALVEQLTPDQLRHVLLHEGAHLLRRDDWWALGERFVRAIFFFQPAVYWIARQIEREREIACDDWVIAQTGNGSVPYANALARVAELGSTLPALRAPILATGAGRPKAIFARLETLLDRTRNRMPSASEPFVLVAGLLILLAASQGAHFNHLFGFSDFSSTWLESDGVNRREFKLRGQIHCTPNDEDVESMSPRARLVIAQSDAWRSRRVDLEADERGVVHRRFFADGIEREFDAEARRFLAKMLPAWVLEQGIDVPERLARIVGAKGVDGGLDLIRSIGSASTKRRYLEELFVQSTLNNWQSSRALKIAADMGSDHDKRVFLENTRERLSGRGLDGQILAFVDTIHSDDDRSQLLGYMIERETVDEAIRPRLLRSVGRLSSDDAKARLLQRAAQAWRNRLPAAFFEAAATLHSDDGRGRILSTVASLHGEDAEALAQGLQVAAGMNSDDLKANAVVAAAGGVPGHPGVLTEASRVLTSMHSDGDRRRAIEALAEADGQNPATLRELLIHTAALNSDGEKTRVLLRVAGGFAEQEPVRRAFFSAVDSLHSSGDQRRVLTAVLGRPTLDVDTLREVSRSATQINSDGDQAAVLKALAERR